MRIVVTITVALLLVVMSLPLILVSVARLSRAQTPHAAISTSAPPDQVPEVGRPPEQPSGRERITSRMRTVRDLVRQQFGVPHGVGCFRENDRIPGGGRGEHHLGRACDFMLSKGGARPSAGQQARGDAIAAWLQANAHRLGISYIIWKQRIWSPGRAREGWRPMSDRGGVTENHFDHVHVTVD
ncbi:hypothetical protein [Nonomuraea sp. KM90]|uniref:hypothetical protein n=1 Tax=Nonomuraea sp. KM90 TaxID=3457428 RepID=UPI003FCE8A0E